MDRLLSDDYIREWCDFEHPTPNTIYSVRELCKSQLAKTDREWIEWFEGICTKHEADNPEGFDQVIQMRMDCWECWEERKKEIGL